jgi:gamma-glutamylcysteine synthetase
MTERVNNPDQTPSGQILAMLTGESISLRQLMQRQSERFHEALVKQPWPGDLNEAFTQSVAQSHDAAKTYPDSDDHHFLEYLDEFVAAYRLAP